MTRKVLFLLVASLLLTVTAYAAAWPFGSAVVDGNPNEWAVSTPLVQLKSGSGQVIANAYGVYTPNPDGSATGYVYVRAVGSFVLDTSTPVHDEHWVKEGYKPNQTKAPWTAFSFVQNTSGATVGYEGSFNLSSEDPFINGCLTIHTLTADDETGVGGVGACEPTAIRLSAATVQSDKDLERAFFVAVGFFALLILSIGTVAVHLVYKVSRNR